MTFSRIFWHELGHHFQNTISPFISRMICDREIDAYNFSFDVFDFNGIGLIFDTKIDRITTFEMMEK